MNSALTIDGVPLAVPRHADAAMVYAAVLAHPGIRRAAELAQTQLGLPLPAEVPVRYICQREYGVIAADQAVVLGSDRATTCHILLVRSPRQVLLTHLDGAPGGVEALTTAVRSRLLPADECDVFLVSGFDDATGLSEELGLEILFALHELPTVRLHLRLVSIGTLNSTPIALTWRGRRRKTNAPIMRGLAYLPTTGQLWFNPPLPFQGPNWQRRCALALAGTEPLFDAELTCRCPDAATLRPWEPALIDYFLQLSDEDLLGQLSSSPYVEHASFAAELRATLRYLRSVGKP